MSYDINGANRVSKVRKGETGSNYYMQSAVYNPAGALTAATLGLNAGSQWTESRAYNSRLQARRVEVTKGADTLLRLRWTYSGSYNNATLEETGTDNNGDPRVERLEFPHQGAVQSLDRTYAYTGADRLSSFSETGGKSQSFGHDAFGNVWQTYVSGVPSLRQTGASWYLQGGVVNNRLANTIHDAAGNQTQLSSAVGTVASYDGENRMSKIVAGGSEISYVYDAEGRRVAKTASGTTTYYFYDAAGQLMAEYGGPAQTAGTQYYTTDYLGSTRLILNGTGACLDRLDYAPFGGQISRSYDCYSGASSEKPLFTGQMRDGESNAGTDTGQDYFNARYFWGNTARFTSPDAPFADQRPEDGQSWNLYAYVRNSPLRWVDLSGEAVELLGDEEERKKGLSLLQASVGNKQAASRLYINEVKDGDKTRYFVGIKGNLGDFMMLGDTAKDVANLVDHKNVVEFGLTSQNLARFGGAVTYEKGEVGNQNVRVLVNPDQMDITNRNLSPNTVVGMSRWEGQGVRPKWNVNAFTPGIATWHEFGHAWGFINGRPGSQTNAEALQWENRMRQQVYGPLGPRNARRVRH